MRPANAPRLRPGTDHVESWFVRANDPHRPRAVWLRSTVLTRRDGSAVAEAWCSVFDGDRTLASRQQVPLADASYAGDGSSEVGMLSLDLSDGGGRSTGEIGSVSGRVRWDLAFRRDPGPLGAPLSLLPSDLLVDAPFPRTTLLTPVPVATFDGHLEWGDERWDLAGWTGMQGHNWGAAHGPEYAWGQCAFPDDEAVLEAASGRIRIGGRTTPLISMLVLRRGGEELRFDRLLDLWRQRSSIDFPRWTLGMHGRAGEVRLEMVADPAAMVCLGYDNPAGPRSYCLNSKTARVRLEVRPRRGPSYTLHSEHGGALELLRGEPVDEVQPVV